MIDFVAVTFPENAFFLTLRLFVLVGLRAGVLEFGSNSCVLLDSFASIDWFLVITRAFRTSKQAY